MKSFFESIQESRNVYLTRVASLDNFMTAHDGFYELIQSFLDIFIIAFLFLSNLLRLPYILIFDTANRYEYLDNIKNFFLDIGLIFLTILMFLTQSISDFVSVFDMRISDRNGYDRIDQTLMKREYLSELEKFNTLNGDITKDIQLIDTQLQERFEFIERIMALNDSQYNSLETQTYTKPAPSDRAIEFGLKFKNYQRMIKTYPDYDLRRLNVHSCSEIREHIRKTEAYHAEVEALGIDLIQDLERYCQISRMCR